MRINYLNLKQGEPVQLAHKISVFVGPNNSGKSQTLKDIRLLKDRPQANLTPVILKDDTSCFEIPTLATIKNDIPYFASRNNVDHYTFEGIRSNLSEKTLLIFIYHNWKAMIADLMIKSAICSSVGLEKAILL